VTVFTKGDHLEQNNVFDFLVSNRSLQCKEWDEVYIKSVSHVVLKLFSLEVAPANAFPMGHVNFTGQ
jgi:hypothetical protein